MADSPATLQVTDRRCGDDCRQAYRQALTARLEHGWALLELARNDTLTLVYVAKDTAQHNARVLADWLEGELERQGRSPDRWCHHRGTSPLPQRAAFYVGAG
ncbi:DUF488 family protein [Pseudomonas sp. SDI]|uniref:DUF488 family protein, N3 subclade n=1 Tax=Pseudomonas sp. SDI TaxID=2170734 RepID=UPI0015B21597